ncbi:hypothetical protein BDR26DRAFT_851096 [Obelidium mucronatum]|nr:hypothetical protein BDR26DRAFT_851096 [Obelidium mucronatum]
MELNNYPWPSIDQLPISIVESINRPDQDTLKAKISSIIEDALVIACEKIDGTNVGVDLTGALFGRRTIIEPTATSYQKTPLSLLGTAQTDIQKLFARLPEVFRLYGEFPCNPHYYRYTESGLGAAWQCFGALLYFSSFDEEKRWREYLATAGFWIKSGRHQRHNITMIACPKFFELLDQVGIPHPPVVFNGRLQDLVKEKAEWMSSHLGEGLVLSIKYEAAGEFQESITAKKWKHYNHLLSESMTEFLSTLLAVATHRGSKPKVVKPMPNLDVYNDVIKSAASKYDDYTEYFRTGRKDDYVRSLMQEVAADYASYADGAAYSASDASRAVNVYVGTRYGAWKKAETAQ